MKPISELIKALYSIKAALLGENVSGNGGNGGNNETNENGGKFDLMMSDIVAPDYICYCNEHTSKIAIVEPSELTIDDNFGHNTEFICVYKERPSDNTKLYVKAIYLDGSVFNVVRYDCYSSLSEDIDTVENTYIGQGYTIPQELLDAYCYNSNAGGGMA